MMTVPYIYIAAVEISEAHLGAVGAVAVELYSRTARRCISR